MSDLKKFEKKHNDKIAQNITTHFSAGLDGFARTMGMDKKAPTKKAEKNRVTVSLDKYENKLIKGRSTLPNK